MVVLSTCDVTSGLGRRLAVEIDSAPILTSKKTSITLKRCLCHGVTLPVCFPWSPGEPAGEAFSFSYRYNAYVYVYVYHTVLRRDAGRIQPCRARPRIMAAATEKLTSNSHCVCER
jgi:hypothetical protein